MLAWRVGQWLISRRPAGRARARCSACGGSVGEPNGPKPTKRSPGGWRRSPRVGRCSDGAGTTAVPFGVGVLDTDPLRGLPSAHLPPDVLLAERRVALRLLRRSAHLVRELGDDVRVVVGCSQCVGMTAAPLPVKTASEAAVVWACARRNARAGLLGSRSGAIDVDGSGARIAPGSTPWCGRVTGTVRRTSRSLLWSRWRRRCRRRSRRPDPVRGLRRTRPTGPGIRHGSPSRWW